MKFLVRGAVEKTVLTLVSAILFFGFFQFNQWLFASLEYRHGVNWVFLPAGFRVILVLVMGLHGALGIMLATWFIDRELFSGSSMSLAFLNGIVSGLTPLLVLKLMNKWQGMGAQLQHLTASQLLNLTLFFSAANALVHHLVWLLLGRADVNIWVDIWPMFIGDASGAMLMLYGLKFVLNRIHLSASVRPH